MLNTKLFIAFLLVGWQFANASTFPIVHSYRSGASGIYSNAYVVELKNGLVVVDATLTVSSAKEVRTMIDEIGKPVYAILITHGHPDHYNGLTEITKGLQIPIYSTQGVVEVIKQYDQEKEKQWKPMFQDEWPVKRTFPNHVVKDGETLTFEDTQFTVYDLGAGESHSDSYWVMKHGSVKEAFIGDVVLYKVHAYLSDGHVSSWLEHLNTLKTSLKDVSILYPGHGLAGGLEMLDWQKQYLETYLKNLKPLWEDKQITEEEKNVLVKKMKEFLDSEKLTFLIGLGAEPVGKAMFK
jgi:glyoxylase-like metal-dependent hydrolase (beta-lactamase superfamily II)